MMLPIGPDLPQGIRQLIPWLALAHGVLNGTIMLFFFYQGWLGHLIRRQRRAAAPLRRAVVTKHRKNGSRLALLCAKGFLFGLILVLIDRGRISFFPLHFYLGLTIVLLAGTAYLLSRRIRESEPVWRARHRSTAIFLLCCYPVQALVGLSILL